MANGRKVLWPKGTYVVSGTLATWKPGRKQAWAGEGVGFSTIQLAKDCDAPILIIDGISYSTLDDINFDGADHKGQWIKITNSAHLRFGRCRWGKTRGPPAISGYTWWDSDFKECRWDNLDAGVELLAPQDGKSVKDCCNNITFSACSLEVIGGTAISMGKISRKNRIDTTKFERCGVAIDCDTSQVNIVAASQFTQCKRAVPATLGKLKFVANILD